MPERNVTSLNTLFSCYIQSDSFLEALTLVQEMVAGEVTRKKIISWNAAITECVLNIYHERALELLDKMMRSVTYLNIFTLSRLGKLFHCNLIKMEIMDNSFVSVHRIDMYFKCLLMKYAAAVYQLMLQKDLVAMSAMISGHSQNGKNVVFNAIADLQDVGACRQIHALTVKSGYQADSFVLTVLLTRMEKFASGKEVLKLFIGMLKDGVTPNHVTLVSVLCTCNHAGILNEAGWYFETMKENFCIEPTQDHYACMIDVLGRAEKLDRVVNLVDNTPFEANTAIWGGLLRLMKDSKVKKESEKNLLICFDCHTAFKFIYKLIAPSNPSLLLKKQFAVLIEMEKR
ncbi:pentatricopeptide repeat-containing protein-like [Dorcoceras hygrometricum]|uniref:Pentatricopeptide repeat-containing protein-like n=1 Tax=Dorcoceras hygrometricum TaxID=472368 RepID=A0A2Z7ANM6_9LAMI|nr:pentatricopeptide repeat-containing protein-like [Dorcoceras hygrometricum]